MFQCLRRLLPVGSSSAKYGEGDRKVGWGSKAPQIHKIQMHFLFFCKSFAQRPYYSTRYISKPQKVGGWGGGVGVGGGGGWVLMAQISSDGNQYFYTTLNFSISHVDAVRGHQNWYEQVKIRGVLHSFKSGHLQCLRCQMGRQPNIWPSQHWSTHTFNVKKQTNLQQTKFACK